MFSCSQSQSRAGVTLHVSVWVEISRKKTKSTTSTVTLHVSVWVEILYSIWLCTLLAGHAPRERVSWNLFLVLHLHLSFRHAPRERVSWNLFRIYDKKEERSHAPRERVSWNQKSQILFYLLAVTLHVSVWVEIQFPPLWKFPLSRHAPRERVSWNVNQFW